MSKLNVVIIGGGNLAHALVARFGNRTNTCIYTRNYRHFTEVISDYKCSGILHCATNDLNVFLNADVVISTVPSFVRKKILKKIKPYINKKTILGSFPGTAGFNDDCTEVGIENVIFSSERVPCISRIQALGSVVKSEFKKNIKVAVDNKHKIEVSSLLSDLLKMDIITTDDFMEVNLSNSNPLLHSARLLNLHNSGNNFSEIFNFYEDWTFKDSELLLKMDKEFMSLVKKLKIDIKSLKTHYEVDDAFELTEKLRSINSFKGIKTPLVEQNRIWKLDTNSRYFTEDINIGLKYIVDVAVSLEVDCPTLLSVYKTLCTDNDNTLI